MIVTRVHNTYIFIFSAELIHFTGRITNSKIKEISNCKTKNNNKIFLQVESIENDDKFSLIVLSQNSEDLPNNTKRLKCYFAYRAIIKMLLLQHNSI